MKIVFTIGDRIRLTAIGASRCPGLAEKAGTIVGRSIYANSAQVRFDGKLTASTLHHSYLEPIGKLDLSD